MRFPLADWIAAHPGCRHDLSLSGMKGSIRPPRPGTGPARAEDLLTELGRTLGVGRERVFLTHGATEANAWVTVYVGRSVASGPRWCRVRLPEYPSLFETAQATGYRVVSRGPQATLAIVSRPRNPEGDLWSVDTLFSWAEGARHLLVDETFREFGPIPTIARERRRGLWTTGTFTKFYGADDLRVGFVVAPEEEVTRFARFLGLVSDEIAPASVASALDLLRRHTSIAREVERVVGPNRQALARAFPRARVPVAPLFFDRDLAEPSDRFAERCVRASVLVCPGTFFGDRSGVRLALTRRTFRRDLAAYLAVRARAGTERGFSRVGRRGSEPRGRPRGPRSPVAP